MTSFQSAKPEGGHRQSHVKWYCKYHVVFVPKYRRRTIYGNLRKQIGGILRELCQHIRNQEVEEKRLEQLQLKGR